MTLWLTRHAQPLIAPGVCYGQLDVAASPQASLACAEELVKALPERIVIITSPLQRCELLALNLRALRPSFLLKTDPRLQEMNFGSWEDRPWADIDATELSAWTDNFAHYRAGSTGESVSQFMARVADAYDALDPATDTLWVTHAGVIRAASLIAQGTRHISQADAWPKQAPAYGQWCKLTV